MNKKQEKSLQKFTKIEDIPEGIKEKDISTNVLTAVYKDFLERIDKYYEEKDKPYKLEKIIREFKEKLPAIYDDLVRNSLWERNHNTIQIAIHNFINNNSYMPTLNTIENLTGLSRVTIHKHIKEFGKEPLYNLQIEKFKFMSSELLSKLYYLGINGNTKAIKIYLDFVTNNTSINQNIKNQNNYIQINNTKIDKVLIDNLPPEAKEKIETIIIDSKKDKLTGKEN